MIVCYVRIFMRICGFTIQSAMCIGTRRMAWPWGKLSIAPLDCSVPLVLVRVVLAVRSSSKGILYY